MKRTASATLLAVLTLLAACSDDENPAPGPGGSTLCAPGTKVCFDDPNYVLTCDAAGARFETLRCPDRTVCHGEDCVALTCRPGYKTCRDGAVVICNDQGTSWGEPLFCGAGKVCEAGACHDPACTPNASRCSASGAVERCNPAGTAWQTLVTCAAGTACTDGVCLPTSCQAGDKECGPATLYTCDAAGKWQPQACPSSQACLFGRCVQCVSNDGCAAGEACVDGACKVTTPEVQNTELPAATVNVAYQASLKVAGGKPPYAWTTSAGALPAGIQLSGTGELMGTPTAPGTASITVKVTDANQASATKPLQLEVLPAGPLRVVTSALPDAEMGFDYTYALQASGGQSPYAWQVLTGALPKGLGMLSTGTLSGIPEEVGTYPLTFRVFDSLETPSYATKNLSLVVKIAPLQIVGEEQVDLRLVKVITLPMLVQYIPYSADLQAKGGLRPYSWTEQAAPSGLGWLIPKFGIPSGLTLSGSGKVSGMVMDTSDAITVSVPFGPTLTGYFFAARVTDSQPTPATADAIYVLPTVPLQ